MIQIYWQGLNYLFCYFFLKIILFFVLIFSFIFSFFSSVERRGARVDEIDDLIDNLPVRFHIILFQ